MVLGSNKIKEHLNDNPPLIESFIEEDNKKNPAKIKLHLGRHCYCSDNPESIIEFKDNNEDGGKKNEVIIGPNSIFIFETYERINMPKELSGHVSLRMSLVKKGLIMPSSTQVDPGFSNVLYNMLYNLNSKPVTIKFKEPILTLEIYETGDSDVEYEGEIKSQTFYQYVQERISSSLGDLHKKLNDSYIKIEELTKEQERRSKQYGFFLSIVTLLIAVITIIVGILGIKSDPRIDLLNSQIEDLTKQVSGQSTLLKEYEEKLSEYDSIINSINSLDESNGNASPTSGGNQ